jgi:hypothetical protein
MPAGKQHAPKELVAQFTSSQLVDAPLKVPPSCEHADSDVSKQMSAAVQQAPWVPVQAVQSAPTPRKVPLRNAQLKLEIVSKQESLERQHEPGAPHNSMEQMELSPM